MDLAKSFRDIYHIEDVTIERLQALLEREKYRKVRGLYNKVKNPTQYI